ARATDRRRLARSRDASGGAAAPGAGRSGAISGDARAAGACGEGGRRKGGALRRRAARGGGRARGRRAEAPGGSGGRMTGTVTTVGTFDGVHRGHQAVLAEIVRRARARGLASLVVTFDPHPLEVVNPSAAPRLLTLPDEKRELMAELGLDRVELVPFTTALARLAPEQFVRDVLRAQYGMQELVLGYDHGFGRGRTGDVDLARRLARDDGFAVEVVDGVRDDGQRISSWLIRTAVAHGDLAAAERWLGRRYRATGVVERGAGRGRTIGFPTLNLAPPDPRKLLPPDGVYAVRVNWRGASYGGMMNQGPR